MDGLCEYRTDVSNGLRLVEEGTVNQVKSAQRVADILEVVAAHPPGLTFSQLLESTSLPKSSLHELLTTMTEQRFLHYETLTKRYTLGSRLWEWATMYAHRLQIVPTAWPFLLAIRNELNETVQLAVLDHGEVMYVAKVESTHPLQLVSHVGSRLPAYATGIGQAILAALPERVIRSLYADPLPTFTVNTVATVEALLVKLAKARDDGYAVDWGEYSPNVRCVAVPILGVGNQVLAGVSVSMPHDRFDEAHRRHAVATLERIASDISKACGALDPHAWRARAGTSQVVS